METATNELIEAPYVVRTPSFEGPLEHLLTLVEARKLFINDVSLASVTNDYLAYIRTLPKYQMEDLTGFIVVAATLILIKSRSLLPNLELTVDEEKTIIDLETRLSLYQKTKEAAELLKSLYGKRRIHLGVRRLGSAPIFSPDKALTKETLHMLVYDLLHKMPVEEAAPPPEVKIRKVMSIDEMISHLTERIANHISMSFREFSHNAGAEDEKEQRVHTIVSFLALLELVREGILDALQNDVFEDITINKLVAETPSDETL